LFFEKNFVGRISQPKFNIGSGSYFFGICGKNQEGMSDQKTDCKYKKRISFKLISLVHVELVLLAKCKTSNICSSVDIESFFSRNGTQWLTIPMNSILIIDRVMIKKKVLIAQNSQIV